MCIAASQIHDMQIFEGCPIKIEFCKVHLICYRIIYLEKLNSIEK